MGMVNIQIIYNLQLDVIIKFIEYKQGKQILKSFMGSKRKSTDIKKKKKKRSGVTEKLGMAFWMSDHFPSKERYPLGIWEFVYAVAYGYGK